jgi:hypothetical protein
VRVTPTYGGTPVPALTYLAVQNDRLFGCDGTSNLLYWSSLYNGDDLGVPSTSTGPGTGGPNAGGNANILTFGESAIQSLLAYGSALLIFHERGISSFTGFGQTDIAINTGTAAISADTGTLAPFSTVMVENFAMFLSDRGFFTITPLGIIQAISKELDSVTQGFNTAAIAGGVSVLHDKVNRQVIWFTPVNAGSSTWGNVLVYNYRTQGWSTWRILISGTPTCAWPAVNSQGPALYFGASDGFVYTIGPGFVDAQNYQGLGGNVVQMILQSKRLYMSQDRFSIKAFRYAFVEATGNSSPSTGTNLLWWLGGQPALGGSTTLPNTERDGVVYNQGQSVGRGNSITFRPQMWGQGNYVTMQLADSSLGPLTISSLGALAYDYGPLRYGRTGSAYILPASAAVVNIPFQQLLGNLGGNSVIVAAYDTSYITVSGNELVAWPDYRGQTAIGYAGIAPTLLPQNGNVGFDPVNYLTLFTANNGNLATGQSSTFNLALSNGVNPLYYWIVMIGGSTGGGGGIVVIANAAGTQYMNVTADALTTVNNVAVSTVPADGTIRCLIATLLPGPVATNNGQTIQIFNQPLVTSGAGAPNTFLNTSYGLFVGGYGSPELTSNSSLRTVIVGASASALSSVQLSALQAYATVSYPSTADNDSVNA